MLPKLDRQIEEGYPTLHEIATTYHVNVVNSKLATCDSVAVIWLNRLDLPTDTRREITGQLETCKRQTKLTHRRKPYQGHASVAVSSHTEAFSSSPTATTRLFDKELRS